MATAPANRLSRIVYHYTPNGLPEQVTAYGRDEAGAEAFVSENYLEYDDRRNLIREWQTHADVASVQPVVEYTWEYSPTATLANPTGGNYNRLTSISPNVTGSNVCSVRRTWPRRADLLTARVRSPPRPSHAADRRLRRLRAAHLAPTNQFVTSAETGK